MGLTRTRVKREWNKINYYRIALTIPVRFKEPLKEYVEANNTTINKLLNNFIMGVLDNTNTSIYDTNTTTNDTNVTIDNTNVSIDDTNTTIDDTNTSTDDTNTTIDDTNASIDDTNTTIDDTNVSIDDTNVSIESQNKPTKKKQPSQEQIKAWIESGLSLTEITKLPTAAGFSRSTIHRRINEYKKMMR